MKTANLSEVRRIRCNLSSMEAYRTETDRPTAKAILMDGFVICNGYNRNVRTKHLGCGVYEVFSVAQEKLKNSLLWDYV